MARTEIIITGTETPMILRDFSVASSFTSSIFFCRVIFDEVYHGKFLCLKVQKKGTFMISSFIKFYKNFTDYFKASSSVSTSFTTSEALLAAVCLYFS